MATTRPDPPARLLDLTRLTRRVGRVLTGVDRVELAYLRALSADPVPCWGIVRTRLGYLLFPPGALADLAKYLAGQAPWPQPIRALTPARAAALYLRRVACGRAIPPGLGGVLRRQLPEGTHYFNTGHSNLTPRMLSACAAMGGRAQVFIHDVIPCDFPQYQRAGTADAFDQKLRMVQAHAAHVICNSQHTADRVAAIMAPWGGAPPRIVAHLGTEAVRPDAASLPPHLPPSAPYFVTLGTIEPRKNHALLLDIWADFGPTAPTLIIAGRRGWNNEAVFARLDGLPDGGQVIEAPGLPDPAVAALLKGARGLLFPSFAEGYGLPAVEAAALGTPVVVSDLPAIREVLGDIPVYASPTDRYSWTTAIKTLAEQPKQAADFDPPSWAAHFNAVLSQL